MGRIPIRYQRSRKRGWRKPENSVYVGRGSKYGNPFVVGKDCKSQAEAVEFYKIYLRGCFNIGIIDYWQWMKELDGKSLGCWCKLGTPCHADYLIDVFNLFITEE